MPAAKLDLRNMAPPERHPTIHSAFDELEPGETLRIVNDHEPKPLFYELQAEVESFDAERYDCRKEDEGKYVADLPKKA
ncbi:DUF2249 domain-containing protein [Haloarcula sp. JP-L23]|uniref:DUF2249 domain-containing protein n=1 Tax=Haloarcula sp. JP-L23 TaxID=2716717 RepID=UPI00140EB7B8|nr:DUF2249 domain-containing protein [Haloarcula sp. JP-L23]